MEAELVAQVQAALEGPAGEDDGCLAEAVALRRFGTSGTRALSLTYCDGRPNLDALASLRELAAAEPPSAVGEASDTVPPPLNPELLVRLQQLAAQFPGRGFEIVSGLRMQGRSTSRHRSGNALDLRIAGVDNAELSAFARTLEATGVGYYPNSTFVHIDVRPSSAYWVDVSAPGEAPEYVRHAPDPRLAGVLLADSALREHGAELPVTDADEARAQPAEPVEGSVASASTDETSPAALEAELRQLAERALLVMHAAQSG